MNTSTPVAKAKKKGPLANAFARIVALEELAESPHPCPAGKLEAHPVTRQYTGRVTMPSYGIPLPAGIGFHGYVKVRLTDDLLGNDVVPPAEADVLALLRQEADAKYPGFVDVEVSDISVLPAGWAEAIEEE